MSQLKRIFIIIFLLNGFSTSDSLVEIVRINKQKKARYSPRLHSNPMANTALILDALVYHFFRSNP
ncbi:hypothetical protein ACQWF5_26425, partial [Salmonella enterica subsp. enterica serovar Infantis]